MYVDPSKGPFCQSCGMTMRRASDFGTDAKGIRVNDYCRFCYVDGAFSEPDLTVEGMIDHCVDFKVRQSWTTQTDAKEYLKRAIPQLRRWHSEPPPIA